MCGVPYNILFNLTHSHHSVIKHLFHEDSLLGMDHLIVGILKLSIGFKIPQIQGSIVLKPLIVRSFISNSFLVFVLLQRKVFLFCTLKKVGDGLLPTLIIVVRAHLPLTTE